MKTNPTETPNPGSQAAIDAGCKCPVMDNEYGAGYHGQPGIFVFSGNCPVHNTVLTELREKHLPLYKKIIEAAWNTTVYKKYILNDYNKFLLIEVIGNILDTIANEVERRGDKGLEIDPGEVAEWLRGEATLAREVS